MFVHTPMRTYIHTYIHTYIQAHIYIYIYIYIYTHTHTHTHIFFYLFTAYPVTFSNTTCLMELYKYKMYIEVVRAVHVRCIRLYALISPGCRVHKFIRSMCLCHTHTYIRTYVHIYVHTYIHTYMLTYMSRHIYVLTQKKLQNKKKCSRPTMTLLI